MFRNYKSIRSPDDSYPISSVFSNDTFLTIERIRRKITEDSFAGSMSAASSGGCTVRFCSTSGSGKESKGRRSPRSRSGRAVLLACVEDAMEERGGMPTVTQLLHRPIALLGMVPQPAALFMAGALAGALAKTISCPLDRTKILMQVGGGTAGGRMATAAASGSVVRTFCSIGQEEGIMGYFKGNLPQVIRAIPYDAVRLSAYESFKHSLRDEDGNLSVCARLVAGAAAGMTSTVVTYPLDTIRFRLAIDPAMRSIPQVVKTMVAQEGVLSLYKGLVPSLAGIAPYIAINYTAFDLFKKSMPEEVQHHASVSFVTAFAATTLATTCCYPLDTLRRQMQLKTVKYSSILHAFKDMTAKGGPLAVYRGFVPNMLKNLPTNSVRLAAFDASKIAIAQGGEVYAGLVAENEQQRQTASC